MASIYTSTHWTAGDDGVITAGDQVTVPGEVVWRTSEHRNVFASLMGGDGSRAPIINIPKLLKGGAVYTHYFATNLINAAEDAVNPEPKLMDFDTHTYEIKAQTTSESVTIKAWREAIFLSELQKQYPLYDLQRVTTELLTDYHALKSATWIMKALLHQTWTGANSSGSIYDASTNATGSGHCTNQIIAGYVNNVSNLASDAYFTGELLSIAKDVAYSGERRASDYTFRMTRPVVGGVQYDGVCIMTMHQKYALENLDPKFREEAIYATPRADDNLARKGLDSVFTYKNVLCLVVTDDLEKVMKFTTSSGIYDEDGTSRTPAVAGATAIFLTANAMLRCPANRDKFLEYENWDGTWFTRAITGQMCGIQRIKIAEPYATIAAGTSTSRDLGCILIHTADFHPNKIVGA